MLDKLEQLVIKAGIKNIEYKDKFTALKIHFGEPGNLAYIRPNYVARIVKLIKEYKGIPFLTDANTLYKGRRDNAVYHLESAMENGFNPISVHCPVIIADGLKGKEYREIEINRKYIKKAKIGSAIADADIIISIAHFKGHEMTGFGGAIKNIGMGSGSIGGKLEMHSSSKPVISQKNCTGCKMCFENCNHNAIEMIDKKAQIKYELCVGCGQCIAVCRFDAAAVKWEPAGAVMDEKVAEYAFAVVKDKPAFYINFLMDISPRCDCFGFNDVPLTPNIGILASSDPVAIDRACVDLVNEAPCIANSVIAGILKTDDKFTIANPNTDWRRCLDHAEKIGLGVQQYEMINV